MPAFRAILGTSRRLLHREGWWAEFWSGVVAVQWAVLSIVGDEKLSLFASMPVLLRIGNGNFWRVILLGFGSLQIAFLIADGRWLRWAMALLMVWLWSMMTIGVWIAIPYWPPASLYFGFAGINIFSVLRLPKPHAR